MQLNSHKIEIVHYRVLGVVIKKYLFIHGEVPHMHRDPAYGKMIMIHKFQRNLIFCFPRIFEYVVVRCKNSNNFDYYFNVKGGQ